MRQIQLGAAILSTTMLFGCATQGKNTLNYDEHPPTKVVNEIVVNDPYSKVWDKLVRELSKSYYVINNIDKESRIINLSFSSTTPQEFVDCGVSTRTYTQGDKVETFKYNVASSAIVKVATPRQPSPSFYYYSIAKRTTNLEGRSNIYLAPDEADKSRTRVAVNTRYILSIVVTGTTFQENIRGAILSSAPLQTEPPTTIAFNTNKPGKHEADSQGRAITCFGNGKLETDVLEILKN